MNIDTSVHLLDAALDVLPLIAILRGITPDEAVPVVETLFGAGFRIAEVPLNSPSPFATIERLVKHFGDRMVLGGGTVTTVEQVNQLAAIGAILCVSPHTNVAVIAAAVKRGLVPMPGFQTATEALAAYAAGARHLKLFPVAHRTSDLAALRAVLPSDVHIVAVGGCTPQNAAALLAGGTRALGVGSDLFRPGLSADQVQLRARVWVAAAVAAPQAGHTVTLACHTQAMVGESPIWFDNDQSVSWVDPVQGLLLRFDTCTRAAAQIRLAEPVSSLGKLADGGIAGTLMGGFCRIRRDTGEVMPGPLAPLPAGLRFNDMAVDSRGGLWAGAMHRGLLAAQGLLCYAPEPDSPARLVARGLGVPNGMRFAPDDRTLFVVDTLARTLLAYAADVKRGHLEEPVIVTDFMNVPGKPDGLALAADGSFWVAMWGGACLVHIGSDGALLEKVDVPAPHVSSVCIGGDGQLWVTTSRARLSPRQLVEFPESGSLFSAVPTPGSLQRRRHAAF